VAIVLALTAGACFAVNVVLVRVAQRRTSAPADAGAVVITATGLVVMAVVGLVTGDGLEGLDVGTLGRYSIIGLIAPGTVQIVFMVAIGAIGPSRTMVLVACSPMLAGLLAVIFLDERWTLPLLAGTVLSVSGGIGLAWDRSAPVPGRRLLGLACAAATALLFGTRDVVTRRIISDSDASVTVAGAAIMTSGGLVLLGIVAVLRRQATWRSLRAAVPAYVWPGLAVGVALPALLRAFERGRVTVVSPVSNAVQAATTVLLATVLVARTELSTRVLAALVTVVVGGTVVVVAG
jgi:drug/metabolite transporter (DMT)-like permease